MFLLSVSSLSIGQTVTGIQARYLKALIKEAELGMKSIQILEILGTEIDLLLGALGYDIWSR